MESADMRLNPFVLINGYSQGIFPMADEDGEIYWYDPNPRAIIPLDESFHVPRRLRRSIRKGTFDVRFNSDFRAVITACAKPQPGREDTWISQEIIAAYTHLHQLGFAHSVEAWQDDILVGGLYGVAVCGLFAGESMFSHKPDASKIALVYLIERLRKGGFVLLDTQFMTNHLAQFGTIEITRDEYKTRLALAMKGEASF
jgi:leucyl/phenylalanyl-tRNA--protein transferase